MAETKNSFSMAAWSHYLTDKANAFQEAFKLDTAKNIAKMNYPNKDELADALANTKLDCTHTAAAIPGAISGFMTDEGRKFDIPAADKKTAPATIRLEEVPEKVTEGTVQFGASKGKAYKSTTKAHTEVKVKSHNKDFKK